MRAILTAIFVSFAGAASAHDYWQSDNLLGCLVGKGVVEMRHGADAQTALVTVLPECKKLADPPPKPDEDGVDYSTYVSGVAYQILTRAADVM